MSLCEIVPYSCIFLDCSCQDLACAALKCVRRTSDRSELITKLQEIWTTATDPRPALPCLSVRSALDLYLSVKNFPCGSEIIISAINIPSLVHILHHHGLKIVTIDVDLETIGPKVELLEDMISERTVAILVAHLYGKWFDIEPFVSAAKRHNLPLIEDCAEVFNGFTNLGHAEADLSLFSFGVIKHCTAFGGAVAKVRDKAVYEKMSHVHSLYPYQSHSAYLKKVLKYSLVYLMVNCPKNLRFIIYFSRLVGFDIKNYTVSCLRGFPASGLIKYIRHQPCTALLAQMYHRFSSFSLPALLQARIKGDYVNDRLPEGLIHVGRKAKNSSYWLFPVMVENPDDMLEALNSCGIDVYRGASQIGTIEPDDSEQFLSDSEDYKKHYPHEAKYIMDHVIYLPVNKNVPFEELQRICDGVQLAAFICGIKTFPVQDQPWKIKSKL